MSEANLRDCYLGSTFNPPLFCDTYLTKKYRFAATRDTEALYYYDTKTGAWKAGGEQIVRAELAANLLEAYKAKYTTECESYLTSKSYMDRSVFNRHPGINLANGVFNTETMKIEEHSPDYYYTYSIPVDYDPKARPARIAQFLADVCGGDGEKLVSLLESIALCLMPDYEIQKAVMLVGNGSNGKSTYLNLLKAFLGAENCSALTLQQIVESSFSTAQLFGKLANVAADLPADQVYDTGAFKSATGGDAIFADEKFKGGITFSNTAKLFFAANRIPPVNDESIAYFRRWFIIEMEARFEKPKPGLLADLTAHDELSGLLNMLIEFVIPRMRKQMAFTFERPVEEVRIVYSRKSNSAKAFVDACLIEDSESTLPKERLWDAYREWVKKADLIPVSETYFWITLKKSIAYYDMRKTIKGVMKRLVVGVALDDAEVKEAKARRRPIKGVLEENYEGIANLARVGGVFYIVVSIENEIINREIPSTSGKSGKETPEKQQKQEILSDSQTIQENPPPATDHPLIVYLKAHGGQSDRVDFERDNGPGSWEQLEPLERAGDVFKPRVGLVRLVHVEEE